MKYLLLLLASCAPAVTKTIPPSTTPISPCISALHDRDTAGQAYKEMGCKGKDDGPLAEACQKVWQAFHDAQEDSIRKCEEEK